MNPYEEWYGIPLVDDIHNYFPDILYNPDRFTSVRDLTNYISQSVRRRFNPELVAAAAEAATPHLTMTRHTHHWAAATVVPSMFTSYHIPQETRRAPPVVQPSEEVQTTIRNFNVSQRELISLVDLTMGLLGARTADASAAAAALEPVRVGATAEQLEAASRVLVVSDTTINANCAICVEPINVGDTCRRITRCHHIFHKDCIDQHFQTSVRCPLCRIDIREMAPAADEPTPTQP
jgi:hypothetical protein